MYIPEEPILPDRVKKDEPVVVVDGYSNDGDGEQIKQSSEDNQLINEEAEEDNDDETGENVHITMTSSSIKKSAAATASPPPPLLSSYNPSNFSSRRVLYRCVHTTSLVSSKSVKLTNQQKLLIDTLVSCITSRVRDTYSIAKSTTTTSSPPSTEISIPYLDFPFLIHSLTTLMRKYPLVIPYILERRVDIPEFAVIFKQGNSSLTFLDFLLVSGSISAFKNADILSTILDVNYAFFEATPSRDNAADEVHADDDDDDDATAKTKKQ